MYYGIIESVNNLQLRNLFVWVGDFAINNYIMYQTQFTKSQRQLPARLNSIRPTSEVKIAFIVV